MYNRRDAMRDIFNVQCLIYNIKNTQFQIEKKHVYIFDLHVVNFIFINKVEILNFVIKI
jgi:hypothetical protein